MDPLLAQQTVPARVADAFVFRRVAPDRYAHVGGVGRGEGWAGIVSMVPGADDEIASLPGPGEVRTTWSDDAERRFGPYWSRFCAVVGVSHDVVVVFGADDRVEATDEQWKLSASTMADHVTTVTPAKHLADELELLHAVRDVALIPAGGVEEVGRALLVRLTRALSCEVGGLLLPSGVLLTRIDQTVDLDEGLVRLALRSLLLQHRDGPACRQDARDAVEGAWMRSYLVRPMGDDAALVLAHTDAAPRGFTDLCQQLADSATTAAVTVLRAAHQYEAVRRRAATASAEARSDALTGLGNRRAWDEAIGAHDGQAPAAVVVCDLDGLKESTTSTATPPGTATCVRPRRSSGASSATTTSWCASGATSSWSCSPAPTRPRRTAWWNGSGRRVGAAAWTATASPCRWAWRSAPGRSSRSCWSRPMPPCTAASRRVGTAATGTPRRPPRPRPCSAPTWSSPSSSEILRTLLHLPAEHIDEGIQQALAALGRALELDRAYVFRIGATTCSNTHEWCAPGIRPERDHLQDLPLALMAPWLEAFERGEAVQVTDVDTLDDEHTELRQHLEAQDIQSLLALPMVFEGEVVGFVGFDAVRSRRTFGEVARGLLGTVADVLAAVDARRHAGQRVERAESRAAELLRHSRDHVFLMDADGRISWASQSFRQLDEDPDELVGRRLRELTHPEDVELVDQLVATWLRSGARADLTLPDHRGLLGGQDRWMSLILHDARSQPGVEGIIVAAHDVTQRRSQTERLRHLALHDDLTGLPNRALLKDRLEVALHRAARNAGRVGVLFLGLDGFKLVNDSRSHAVGDELLRRIAERLRAVVRGAETCGRFGGDQFVVVIEVDDPPQVQHAVDRVVSIFDAPFTVAGMPQTVSASFGLRIADPHELDPDAVLRDADNALFAAKAGSRGRLVAFDPRMRERAIRDDQVRQRLPDAIAAGDVRPHYQPLVDLPSGRVVGVEALARWTDDELGVVSPVEFIPVAEQSGVIRVLGTHVLRQACRDAAGWPADTYVSVNLSPSQLEDADLCAVVGAALDDSGLPPRRLVLEVTESLLMRDTARATQILEQLRGLGIRVALDDFGTGHSSLAVLGDLPLDMIKIDRSFVTRMLQDDRGARMVDGIVSLADDLGLLAVAEGVETHEQAERLRRAGCQVAQGWLFGRPEATPAFPPAPVGAHAPHPTHA